MPPLLFWLQKIRKRNCKQFRSRIFFFGDTDVIAADRIQLCLILRGRRGRFMGNLDNYRRTGRPLCRLPAQGRKKRPVAATAVNRRVIAVECYQKNRRCPRAASCPMRGRLSVWVPRAAGGLVCLPFGACRCFLPVWGCLSCVFACRGVVAFLRGCGCLGSLLGLVRGRFVRCFRFVRGARRWCRGRRRLPGRLLAFGCLRLLSGRVVVFVWRGCGARGCRGVSSSVRALLCRSRRCCLRRGGRGCSRRFGRVAFGRVRLFGRGLLLAVAADSGFGAGGRGFFFCAAS